MGRVILRWEVLGDEKVKQKRKVGESVKVKKMSRIWWAQFFIYLNLSKILHLKKKNKRERKYK